MRLRRSHHLGLSSLLHSLLIVLTTMNPSALVVLKTITSVWSIGLYLSPAPTVYRIYKTKATGETQLIPFVTMICNYYLWYGAISH